MIPLPPPPPKPRRMKRKEQQVLDSSEFNTGLIFGAAIGLVLTTIIFLVTQ